MNYTDFQWPWKSIRMLAINILCAFAPIALAQMGAAGGIQGGGSTAGQATCYGYFINPIDDICWDCIFPISIGPAPLSYGQEDIENPGSPICICPTQSPPYYRIGLEIGFWEPSRLVEATRTPFCFPTLEGFYMDSGGGGKPYGATSPTGDNNVDRDSFYQVHYFINPILYYLNTLVDSQCLEVGSYDLAYMSEYDPQWHDDMATALIEPEAVLFANVIAQLACTADCIATAIGFGIPHLFWCSGCNGPVYPMNGNVPVHIGGVQASALLVHRILAKMHRLGIAKQWHGQGAVCQAHDAILMDKRGYKTQIVYPVPMTAGTDGTAPNRCCQPLGRSTIVYGTGREFPIRGEDFGFQVFRKRNCCLQTGS